MAALLACATSSPQGPNKIGPDRAPLPIDPGPAAATEGPAPGAGVARDRFDLPGECAQKFGVARDLDDLAECEGALGDAAESPVAVAALIADADVVDARIVPAGSAQPLGDALLHGSLVEGRPTSDGDLAIGRFHGEFASGARAHGFVVRARRGQATTWSFHITGGAGCLAGARGELVVRDRANGMFRLTAAAAHCGAPPVLPDPSNTYPPQPPFPEGTRGSR